MFANILTDYFEKGGPIMWPILAALFGALCVIVDRVVWWLGLRRRLRPVAQTRAHEALEAGDFAAVCRECSGPGAEADPYLRSLRCGIDHARGSMLAAMQMEAAAELERAEARQWVLSTMITLAPLLGLMGTVVGIMQSFDFVGDEQLAASKVSGGIAEALIATACGLGIAILCLLPYNFFRRRVTGLRRQLERWINHTELLVAAARENGHDLESFVVRRDADPRLAASMQDASPSAPDVTFASPRGTGAAR